MTISTNRPRNGPVPNNGFALALRTVAGSIVRGIGTRVYWVQTGGFDTHASQGNAGGGGYATLMGTLSDGLFAFGENAQREAHEIGIGEQLRHPIDIVLAEWSQNQSLSFDSWHWKK